MLLTKRQLILLSLASLLIQPVSATPIHDGLTLWLDANDSSTLFTDLDCKKPAGKIDYVSCWKDKSEHYNNVSLILKSSRAKRQFDISNKKTVVKFNQSGFITEIPGQITANTSYTKFVLFKIDNDKGDKQKKGAPKHNLIGSDPYETTLWANNGRLHSEHHSDNYLDSKQKLNTRKYHIATTRYSKPEVPVIPNVLNLDGKQEASNYNKSDHETTFTTIGSVGSPNKLGTYFYLEGKIAEALIYDKALNDVEIDEVEQYLAKKWGLKLKQNITFQKPNGKKSIGNAIQLHANASSGLAVTFTSTTPDTCKIIGEGEYIQLDVTGVCTVKGNQKGNKIYPKAPPVTQTFLITAQ
ncbi:MAG: hypothetical protein V3V19_07905 [Cocleimonas sp.]